jgi:hypothetical protein
MVVGYIPVINADLLGAHTPDMEYALVYLTPWEALPDFLIT